MQFNLFFKAVSIVGLAIAANGLSFVSAASAANFQLIGLTDNNSLVTFSADRPDLVKTKAISGLQTGETILGFDRRPANDKFYAITDAQNLYIIDVAKGTASFQRTLNIRASAGTFTGVDFNPRPDLLRLVNGNDENFRINVDTGEVFDDTTASNGSLKYNAGDVNEGVNPNVNAVAYTNSFAPSPDPNRVTQLLGLDTDTDALVLQDPPNNGNLTTLGSLGVDLSDNTGFEIFSTKSGTNLAFATSGSTLYGIDISSTASGNRASILGSIGNGNTNIIGLASQATPEPTALAALAAVSLFGFLGLQRRKAN